MPALARAALRAQIIGVPARRCLIVAGDLTDEAYAAKLAAHLDLDLAEGVSPEASVDVAAAMRQGWFRGRTPDGRAVLVVSALGLAHPVLASMARMRRPMLRPPVAVASEAAFIECLRGGCGEAIAAAASRCVPDDQSARLGLVPRQSMVLAATFGLVSVLPLVSEVFLILMPLGFGLVFLAWTILQLTACFEPEHHPPKLTAIDARALPPYTILVPLHREAAVINQLVSGLARIDYLPEKLQVLLIVEADDHITQAAIARSRLPPNIAMFIAPDGRPRTKPRALNAAMPFVTGAFVVVYDAEDRPDPLQLRRAVATFAQATPDVVCLQARLVIDNAADTYLTRFFAIEYAALFDVIKAACSSLGLPVPLGGTSNHFRVSALRRVGQWDAWNVTEDADLGYRLARYGMRVGDLASDTLEEAPLTLRAWLAQRTRWLKGWMQTIITHSRQPVRTWQQMGTLNFAAAIVTSTGVILGSLVAPIFTVLVGLRMVSGDYLSGTTLLSTIADGMMTVVFAYGCVAIYLPPLVAMRRRRLSDLIGWLPLLPVYHLLMFVAGWRALYELIVAPHRWNKTMHGFARSSRAARRRAR